MHVYEIRIRNTRFRSPTFVELPEVSDDNAIRSALRLADGRAVEVWRDMDCVYSGPAQETAQAPSGTQTPNGEPRVA